MPWSSTDTKPPMFGALIEKSLNANSSDPRTWITLPFSWAFAGMSTVFVTPWRVRSPWRVTSTWKPVAAAAGRRRTRQLECRRREAVGLDAALRRRLSRIWRSLASDIISTLNSAAVTLNPPPLEAIVAVPLIEVVRPTASLSADRLASRSRTRSPTTESAPIVSRPARRGVMAAPEAGGRGGRSARRAGAARCAGAAGRRGFAAGQRERRDVVPFQEQGPGQPRLRRRRGEG